MSRPTIPGGAFLPGGSIPGGTPLSEYLEDIVSDLGSGLFAPKAATEEALAGKAGRSEIADLVPRCPLDGIGGIYAAYGAVKLVSTWLGPIVTIRRSSDQGALDCYPNADGTLAIAQIKAFAKDRSVYVSKWWDQSGNDRHATHSSTLRQPELDLDGSKPALYFNGKTMSLELANAANFATLIPHLTIAATVRADSSANSQIVHIGNASAASTRVRLGINDGVYTLGARRLDADAQVEVENSFDANAHVVVARIEYVNSDGYLTLDGNTAASLTFTTEGYTPGSNSLTPARIGCNLNGTTESWTGPISSVVLLSNASADLTSALVEKLSDLRPAGVKQITQTTLFTAPNGGQGLAASKALNRIWWAEHKLDGDPTVIYMYDYAGNSLGNWPGPEHCQTLDLHTERGTLLACEFNRNGISDPITIQEMNRDNGTVVRTWTLNAVDYGISAAMCYVGGNKILFRTAVADASPMGAFRIREVTLNDDGTYTLGSYWDRSTGLGLLQGMVWRNGHLYYITDDGGSSQMATIYKLKLEADGSITVAARFGSLYLVGGAEAEGLSWDGEAFLFGTINENIVRLTGIT